MPKSTNISKATLERLPIYLNYLQDLPSEITNISATSISKELGLGEVQVRKDLSLISDNGRPKTGYNVKALIDDLSSYLGCNNILSAVIVGAGKLGRAILGYEGFRRYGVEIKAAFGHHGNEQYDLQSNKPILQMDQFESYVKENNIKVGIITVPVKYAQEVCNMMVRCGIKGIWNFARKTLNVPSDVIIRQEDLAAGIAILSCKLKNQNN